jgi:hypothetical protein
MKKKKKKKKKKKRRYYLRFEEIVGALINEIILHV